MGAVLNTLAQNVYDAAVGNFTFQSGQEFAPCRTVFIEGKGASHFRLCCAQEGGEMVQVYAVLTIVVVWGTAYPADAAVWNRGFS